MQRIGLAVAIITGLACGGRTQAQDWSPAGLSTMEIPFLASPAEPQPAEPLDVSWTRFDTILRSQDSIFDEPLATDRPDFTEASSTVGRTVMQIETGYTFIYDNSAGTRTRTHSFPETVFRYGVLDNVELRLVWNYLWQDDLTAGVADRFDGAEDLLVGTKLGLTSQNGYVPESALIIHLGTPTGGAPFTNQHTEIEFNYLFGWDLADDKYLAGSVGYSTATAISVVPLPGPGSMVVKDHHNIFHASLSHGFPVTESVTVYVEYFGLFPDELRDGRQEHYVDGGPMYLINNDLQLDMRLGIGLNEAADNLFAGTGLSARF